MTGFGKVTTELPSKKVTIEIKALNSKLLDLSARMPAIYREKEMDIRNEISQKLGRGKVDFSIFVETVGKDISTKINVAALENYVDQINNISEKMKIPVPADWFQVLMRMPDVIKNEIAELEDSEWKAIHQTINQVIEQLIQFRVQEGAMLQKTLEQNINNIASLLKELEPYEAERVAKIKTRITEALIKVAEMDYDKNRLEQEMIYYIEKLDINEEKTRLLNHLNYFVDTMNAEQGQGRKLSFIAQEIGREVNTLGSKSNHAEIQKIVVQMKDELEQIKEQVLNVL